MNTSLRQLFLQHVAQTSDAPLQLEINRAEGMYLYSPDGQRYMDLIAGIGVSNVGHCHPHVVQAVQEQAARYMHLMVYGEYIYYPQVQLSKLLCAQLPPSLNNVYLTNSGAEAVEGAMKLAKRYTERPEIISFKNAYHGSTQGALSIMGDELLKNKVRPLLPATRTLHYNVKEDIAAITTQTAAVVAEVVQAEAGVIAADAEFLQALRQRCTEQGALLIFDEIQSGFGRCGTLFAFEQYGVVPDILLLAKGMGGGLPIGAFIADKKIMSSLSHDPVLGHITTFGGNAVCAAAALATLEVLVQNNLIAEVKEKEQCFLQYLQHPRIKAVRSKGLMIAVELDSFDTVLQSVQYCIKNGIIVDWFLFAPHCLRIAPPLLITPEEIQTACTIITKSLD